MRQTPEDTLKFKGIQTSQVFKGYKEQSKIVTFELIWKFLARWSIENHNFLLKTLPEKSKIQFGLDHYVLHSLMRLCFKFGTKVQLLAGGGIEDHDFYITIVFFFCNFEWKVLIYILHSKFFFHLDIHFFFGELAREFID